uniref:Uncharacterized protein n=1 Tax=uncultured marine virus TaxID=186617 RepID=A0A0F7L743_9VIRU|nr:hypothetical protein [uncultured marine virus]
MPVRSRQPCTLIVEPLTERGPSLNEELTAGAPVIAAPVLIVSGALPPTLKAR